LELFQITKDLVPTFNKLGANVTIAAGQRVLLDITPPQLGSISISGELVIANKVLILNSLIKYPKNLNLTVKWIRVNSGGKLTAGSVEAGCQISAKFIVTFVGPRTTGSEMGTDPFDGGTYSIN
jgi:hypothetical protein